MCLPVALEWTDGSTEEAENCAVEALYPSIRLRLFSSRQRQSNCTLAEPRKVLGRREYLGSIGITIIVSTSVLHISRQNNYVRIGPVTEAVLSAIVFVSMIADGPMEMAIIVSDPQQKGA
jgi:hypothetical protein